MTDQSMKRTKEQDYAFTCGELAHFAGLSPFDCPWPITHSLNPWWHRGWEHSAHLKQQAAEFRAWEAENGI